jgi:hypothetical protein
VLSSCICYIDLNVWLLSDDPTLDARLTYVRRHSGLDSRAALFVLSPVSQTELGEFVKRCDHLFIVSCKMLMSPKFIPSTV